MSAPNWYDQWGTGDPTPPVFYYPPTGYHFEPVPCSCGRSSRHLFVTHWFRLLWMRERW